jgi:hypothetical protein
LRLLGWDARVGWFHEHRNSCAAHKADQDLYFRSPDRRDERPVRARWTVDRRVVGHWQDHKDILNTFGEPVSNEEPRGIVNPSMRVRTVRVCQFLNDGGFSAA